MGCFSWDGIADNIEAAQSDCYTDGGDPEGGVRTTADAWTGSIQLIGLRCGGSHGALVSEATQSQPFVVDLRLDVDVQAAGTKDDLGATVDYSAAAALCTEIIAGSHRTLIETLAVQIAERLLLSFAALRSGEVIIHKPRAPMAVAFEDVSVRLAFSRNR